MLFLYIFPILTLIQLLLYSETLADSKTGDQVDYQTGSDYSGNVNNKDQANNYASGVLHRFKRQSMKSYYDPGNENFKPQYLPAPAAYSTGGVLRHRSSFGRNRPQTTISSSSPSSRFSNSRNVLPRPENSRARPRPNRLRQFFSLFG